MRFKRIALKTAAWTTVLVTLVLVLNVYAAPGVPDDAVTPHQDPPVTFPPLEGRPWYAQHHITIHPEAPEPGQPVHICADVVNQTPDPQTVQIAFGVTELSIGMPFDPIGVEPVDVPPDGTARGCVVRVAPDPGDWCIEARLIIEGHDDQIIQRNIDFWEPLVPGQTHERIFEISNPLPVEGPVEFDFNPYLEGWQIELVPARIANLNPGEVRRVRLLTTPPQDAVLGSRRPIVDVEAFLGDESLGGIRKMDTPTVPLHRTRDPFFAESEIHVHPYPPRAGEPTEICVELTNISDDPHAVRVFFSVADFGIGLPFAPIEEPLEEVIPPHETRVVCTHWVPPEDGHFCVQIELETEGPYARQFSQRNLEWPSRSSRAFRTRPASGWAIPPTTF